MKQNILLYVEDWQVDLDDSPNILFNYTETDITNPTVIKNGYSKTLSLPGTQKNCEIFGEIWNLEHTQFNSDSPVGSSFNPSKKAEYSLYVNNQIVESGYLKLNNVNIKKNIITFNVTLYSGIGDFFYSLSYNEEGERLKLSDLNYMLSAETYSGETYTFGTSGDSEFDMVINRKTLASAWNGIQYTPASASYSAYRKWSYINFAPCYNATPTENFSADKVLINFSGSTLSAETSGYTARNGYALGTLPEKMDEWGVRDLRSYLQRPVLRIRGLIGAICDYARQVGYEVDLSPVFFNENNPYYQRTWLTMPMLTEMNLVGTDVDASVQNLTFSYHSGYTINGWTTKVLGLTPSEALRVGSERMELNVTFLTSGRTSLTSDLITSTFINGERNFCAYAVQLLVSSEPNFQSTSTIIAASDVAWLTTRLPNGDYLKVNETYAGSYFNKDFVPVFGKFVSQGSGVYQWDTPFTLTLDSIPSNAQAFALRVVAVANLKESGNYKTYGDRQGRCYTSSAITSTADTNTAVLVTSADTVNHCTASVTMKSSTAGYSGAKVGKRTLLDTEHTPAEYLISYCKQFGLHFLKNPNNKVVRILTREEFYNDPVPVDIQHLVDRSDMKINPVSFDKKYYDMQLESVGGVFADKYKEMYSRTYGSQRIDTGYEFDTEPKDVLSGNTLKCAVQCIQKSKYYLSPIGYVPSYRYQGLTYQLYSGYTGSASTIDISINERPTEFLAIGYDKYYDQLDKPQFRDDDDSAVKGENVLLFYSGIKSCKNASGVTIYYTLSDDVNMMGVLNDGTSCWVYTESLYTQEGQTFGRTSYLPYFSRYLVNVNTSAITRSLDFGEPKQLYIDGIGTTSSSTIYEQYWRKYIEDMYDVNTRIVTCKVQLEKRPSQELMRKFYYFDNSYWRLNKINNYNVSSYGATECEFIKVNDISNYTGV